MLGMMENCLCACKDCSLQTYTCVTLSMYTD